MTKNLWDRCDFEGYSGKYLMKQRRETNPGMNLFGDICCNELKTNITLKVHKVAIQDDYAVQYNFVIVALKTNQILHFIRKRISLLNDKTFSSSFLLENNFYSTISVQ